MTNTPRAGDLVTNGLLSEAEADAANLGRFGHHPDAAIDFCVEVEELTGRLHSAKHGISKPGTEPETIKIVADDIARAMTFKVGGDEGAVYAKHCLRKLEDEARAALAASPALPAQSGAAMREGEAKRIDGMFDRFLDRYAEYDGNVSADDLADYLGDVRHAVRAALSSLAPEGEAAPNAADRAERLMAAIEGECEGLAINDDQAAAILRYVDGVEGEAAQGVEPNDAYYAAIYDCLDRYRPMAVAAERRDLWEFIDQCYDEIGDRSPLHKLNRWLGYIQGVLIEIGCTDVTTERDWSRPHFRPLDFPSASPSVRQEEAGRG